MAVELYIYIYFDLRLKVDFKWRIKNKEIDKSVCFQNVFQRNNQKRDETYIKLYLKVHLIK